MTNFLLRKSSRDASARDRKRVVVGMISAALTLLLLGGFDVPSSVDVAQATNHIDVSGPADDRRAEEPVQEESEQLGSESDTDERAALVSTNEEPPGQPNEAPPVPDEDRDQAGTTGKESPEQDASELDQAVTHQSVSVETPQTLDVTLAAAPPLGLTDALIVVRAGSFRDYSAGRAVQGLAGVTLQLHEPLASGLANMNAPVADSWATCVSDIDGNCYFTVPLTGNGGVNRDRQFVVVQTGAPNGWYMNGDLKVGWPDVAQDEPYQFLTGKNLRAGNTYSSGTTAFMNRSVTDKTGSKSNFNSMGVWQSSLDNPKFVCRVGLRVALVLDLSGSVRPTLDDLQQAAIGYVRALEGTGSSIALYTFANGAPSASGPAGRNYPSRDIDTNIDAIERNIMDYQASGATNWDAGIYQVARSAEQYDVTVMVTDGMPTHSTITNAAGTGTNLTGNGIKTEMVQVEGAIFSANTLKGKADPNLADHTGTRLVVVGVGSAINSDPANLAAVSGLIAYDAGTNNVADADFFQVEWEALQEALKGIADTTICSANVKVIKQIQRSGSVTEPEPGVGWDFKFEAGGEATWGADPVAIDSQSQTRKTGADGTTEDILFFESESSDAVIVSLEEQMTQSQVDARWTLADKSCQINGEDVEPTSSDEFGLQLSVNVADRVECTFVNVQAASPGIKLVKSGWATDDPSKVSDSDDMDPDVDEIIRGTVRPLGSTVTWTYDVTNLTDTLIRNVEVVDDRLVSVSCPLTELAPFATMRCTGTGILFDTQP